MSETKRVCADLNAALDELRGDGFRLDSIYPADDPHTARLSRGDEIVRLTTRPDSTQLTGMAPFESGFVLTRSGAAPGEGRAGMLYRDLIPGRLGGRYIASHITIPEGGPVADWVHYHRIAVQLIFVRRGWVKVVYQGQGEPFTMRPGDLVLQPPGIRHRVLESSPGLEVIEISAPAMHETLADHDLALPDGEPSNAPVGGQHFLRHIAADAPWTPFGGGEAQETRLFEATAGISAARVVRALGGRPIFFPPHDGELVFGFMLEGTARLDHGAAFDLGPADAFVIPPGEAWVLTDFSDDGRLLHVTTARLDADA